jgi:anti-sigma factor RsiW
MSLPDDDFGNAGPGDEDAPYEWLDEWLCEYVDGTMDPSLQATFEQYVEANPQLKAHIERLQETRDLLAGTRPDPDPDLPPVPPETKQAVCSEVERDHLATPSPVSDLVAQRPLTSVASSVAAALLIGFLAGAVFNDPASSELLTADPSRSDATPSTDATAPPGPSSASHTAGSGLQVILERPASTLPADSARRPTPFRTLGTP